MNIAHAHDHDHGDEQATHPQAAVHGMLVVGERTVYLSHLPMFGHPRHDVQAILEVRLTGDEQEVQATYAEDRRRSGEPVYTLEPEHFVTGTLYRGHFERGGDPLLQHVTVTVDQVVHFRQFDPEADKPVIQHYLLFGRGDERFLAHLITSPPDFDQVVSVQVTGHDFSDDDLRAGPTLFFPRRRNTSRDRLRAGEQVSAEMQGGSGLVRLEIGNEFYFEEDELAAAGGD
jgi:hypothetical protein